jgi:NTP pyrophosphatase (non-canonical NTP hydrolase)
MARKQTDKEFQLQEHERCKQGAYIAIEALEPGFIGQVTMLQELISNWNLRQGFWASGFISDSVTMKLSKLALIHSEVSECVEAVRKPDMTGALAEFNIDLETEELADAVIRILDYAGHYNLDVAEAVTRKLRVNLERPYMHGKEA